MNALKKLALSTLAALTGVSLFAAPLKVSDVKVTTAAPHGLAIDYKVSDVQLGAEDYVLEVALTLTNGTTKTAKTLSGDTSASAGLHRIYWNIATDGVASFAGATLSVSYINPLEVVCDGKKYCVIDLSAGSNAASYPLEFLDDAPAGGFNADVYKKTKLVLKRIEAGDFIMGADQTSANALAKCKVTLTKAFYVGLFQVTQRQYELVTGSNPSNFKSNGEKRPVERVSYNMIRGEDAGARWPVSKAADSTSFLGKLRARTGLNFDLPTEAQWEYACRAGSQKTYNLGNTEEDLKRAAWYSANSGRITHDVGTKEANAWGLYDMHGNVWEWCLDWSGPLVYGTDPVGPSYSADGHKMRGGSYTDGSFLLSSWFWIANKPTAWFFDFFGFRIALPVDQKASNVCEVPDVAASVSADTAPLKVSDVTVTPISPFGLAIDYTVSDVQLGAVWYAPRVTLTLADGATHVARTLAGDTTATAGVHRVYWNLAKDGVPSFTGATVSVTYKDKVMIDEPRKVEGDGAAYCVIDLSGGPETNSYPLTFLDAAPTGGFTTEEYKKDKLVLKRIEAGTFVMGEDQTSEDAKAKNKVTLTQPFYMALFETTQMQWERVTGGKPSWAEDNAYLPTWPVESVSYRDIRGESDGERWPADNKVDAGSFLGKLRARTGLNFDLPTEAQWEYACRAGSKTAFSHGSVANGDHMWFSDNSSTKTHEVGTRSPNPWLLYDMHGNVGEWCLDADGTLPYGVDPKGLSLVSDRAQRGGSFNKAAAGCTSFARHHDYPSSCGGEVGFRLSRTMPAAPVTPATAANVSASVIKDGAAVEAAIQFDYLGAEGALVSITVGLRGETNRTFIAQNKTGTGSVSWWPSDPGTYEFAYVVGDTTVADDAPARPETVLSATYTREKTMSFSETTLASFNYSGTYDGAAHGIALTNGCAALASISGATVSYTTVEADVAADRYAAENPTFKNAGTNTVFYRITASGYTPYRGSATVEIKPRAVTAAMFNLLNVPTDGYVWDGNAKAPDYSYQDGSTSIIGPDDFTVSYSNNVEVGTATVTFSGKNNYKGTVKLHFKIVELYADVTFDALGGKVGAAKSVTLKQSHRKYDNIPAAPTRENYTFEGWHLGVANGAAKATANGAWLATDAHTLYAKWAVDPAVLPGAADGVFAYTNNVDGTVTITGFDRVAMRGTSLVIPDTIDGKFVTEIGAGAFANSTKGIRSVALPMFLVKIGRRAFSGIKTLASVTFASVRKWNDPSVAGTLTIDPYAFTSTALTSVRLPKEVAALGEYAFADCRSLVEVTILGSPTVGTRPFRRAGIDASGTPTVRLDPALANNTAYLEAITQGFNDAVVRTDALVESVSLGSLSVAPGAVRLSVAVGRAADWGAVSASRIRVEYRESLGDAPTTLTPRALTPQADGTLAVEVAAPEGASGFFRVKVEE